MCMQIQNTSVSTFVDVYAAWMSHVQQQGLIDVVLIPSYGTV